VKLALMIGAPDMAASSGYVAVPTGPYDETVRRAARLGFDGVEVLAAERSTGDVQALRDALVHSRLALAGLNSGRLMSEQGLVLLCGDSRHCALTRSAMYELIRLAAPFGAHINIGMFRGLPPGGAEQPASERLVGILRELGDYAQRMGIQLLLEPQNRKEFPFIASSREGLALVQSVDHPAVGLMLDTFHMLAEDEDPATSVERAMPLLRHIHLLDLERNPPRPGKGLPHLEAIMAVLARHGYGHYLSVPLVRDEDDEATAECVRWLRGLMRGQRN
jgi:sugar phosphate isomerase/epimerase